VAVAHDLRHGKVRDNDLIQRLGADPDLPLSGAELEHLLGSPLQLVGAAPEQVKQFVTQVEALAARYPAALAYAPGRLL
jgi:adenylosuccinate lyase